MLNVVTLNGGNAFSTILFSDDSLLILFVITLNSSCIFQNCNNIQFITTISLWLVHAAVLKQSSKQACKNSSKLLPCAPHLDVPSFPF